MIETIPQIFSELDKCFDRRTIPFDHKRFEGTKAKNTNQRLAGMNHEAWQARLATEIDVDSYTKDRKHAAGVSTTDRE